MHRNLFALALAAYLMAPSSLLPRFWNLLSGRAGVPAATALEKEGPGLDPYGAKARSHATEAGPGLDPDGATEAGPGLDPSGHS
jgi:hypothetical protein